MTKIRMNTELRNKLFNKIKHTFENEDTQEREAYLQSREWVNEKYVMASQLAKQVVERSYPICLLYTSPSPRDAHESRMPSSA